MEHRERGGGGLKTAWKNRNGVKRESSHGWWCGSCTDSRRVGRRKGQVPLEFLLQGSTEEEGKEWWGAGAVRTCCEASPQIGSRETIFLKLSHFQQAPSTSHRSIKRKETAGVLGGGGRGDPGFVG